MHMIPTLRFLSLTGMILIATALRLVPHPWNFTPIDAMALFGAVHFRDRRAAFAVPLTALFLGDLILGLHDLVPFVYGCFAFTVCLGFWVRRNQSIGRLVVACLLGSLVFFVVTNFSVWALLGTYPKTPAGLIACYVAGLPYLGNAVLGDLFYCGLLFGGFALAQARFTVLRESSSSAVTA